MKHELIDLEPHWDTLFEWYMTENLSIKVLYANVLLCSLSDLNFLRYTLIFLEIY